MCEKHKLLFPNRDKIKVRCWDRGYAVDRDSFHGNGAPAEYYDAIYTDGSHIDANSGCGVVHYKRGKIQYLASIRLNPEATVFQAEVEAIRVAADYLKQTKGNGEIIKIFSDSRAALLALATPFVESKVVHKTVKALKEAREAGYVISLHWVRAHIDTEGNECADHLAKTGALHSTKIHKLPISNCVVKAKIKEMTDTKWKQRWQDTVLGLSLIHI